MIGNVVVKAGDTTWQLRPLSVRQLVTMQRVLGERRAADAAKDARAAGMTPDDALRAATTAREDAALSSWLVRWALTLEGAHAIVTEASDLETADAISNACTPDELSEAALQLIGFEWDDSVGKFVSRSRRKSDRVIG